MITNPPVAFQAVFHVAVDRFGERGGPVLLKIACFLLALGTMMGWLRQVRAPVIAWLIVLPLLFVLVQYRAQARPELVSYALSIVAMMLYYRAASRLTAGAIAPIAVLLLAWSYARAEAQALVPLEYSGFLWAALFGWLLFAEPVSWLVLLGAGLIDCLASDNHGDRRSLAAARLWLDELGANEHAQMLTHANASRLLADEPTLPVPPLPLDRGVFQRLRELLFGRR